MAQQAQFRNRHIVLVILFVGLCACNKINKPIVKVNISDSGFKQMQDSLFYHNQPFTGYAFELFANGDTAKLIPFVNGLMDGTMRWWYNNKQLAQQRFFSSGKKQGVHYGWWPNGKLKFVYNFVDDEHNGEAREYFDNGKLFRDFHYNMGHEEGSQKMWWDNGKIRANYVIVNGEKFGLFGQKICVNKAVDLKQ